MSDDVVDMLKYLTCVNPEHLTKSIGEIKYTKNTSTSNLGLIIFQFFYKKKLKYFFYSNSFFFIQLKMNKIPPEIQFLWNKYVFLANYVLEWRKDLQDIINGAESDVSAERFASTISDMECNANEAYDKYASLAKQYNMEPNPNYI